MAERERRELQVPAGDFEFTEDGRLVVNMEQLTRAIEEAGIERGSAAAANAEIWVGIVFDREL
jgi:hypothetical protein